MGLCVYAAGADVRQGVKQLAHAAASVLGVTIVSGAFVAGNDAGLAYPEWPLMGGQFVPEYMWEIQPAWRNVFENMTTVQFDHRMLVRFARCPPPADGARRRMRRLAQSPCCLPAAGRPRSPRRPAPGSSLLEAWR